VKAFDYCLNWLDWVYFACEAGSQEERVLMILQKKRPWYRIKEIDKTEEKGTVKRYFVAGSFQ